MRHARVDELTCAGVEHDYLILYPSGQRFTLRGVVVAVSIGEAHMGIRVGAKVTVLDPRAVVVRDGLIIIDPRSQPPSAEWAQAWLAEHADWPRVATEAL